MAFKTPNSTAALSPAPTGKFVPECYGNILNVLGTKVEIKLAGQDTANQFALFEITAGPGSHVPTHTHHREDEVFVVQEGTVEISLAGQATAAGPGTTAFLPRNIPHSWKTLGNYPARFNLITTPAGFEHYLQAIATAPGQRLPSLEQLVTKSRDFDIYFA